MSVTLNHTIVAATDKRASATFMTEMLGLDQPVAFGPFLVVEVANGVSLDFIEADPPITSQHYAFLIGEQEFDEIYGRIRERAVRHWADPAASRPDEINTHDGGRGVYFEDPDGHLLEVITRPYGSGGPSV